MSVTADMEKQSSLQRRRRMMVLAPVLILIAVLAAYSNVPGNAFEFDDTHCIERNTWLRRLGNIPTFFADARTSTTLQTNADYRPVLVTSFAANYAMSGGTIDAKHFDSWHWTNIAIHFVNACCVFVLGVRLFGSRAIAPVRGVSPGAGDLIALAAAVIFAVHPITAVCVNYVSTRSTSLTAMFVLMSLICYIAALAAPRQWGRLGLSVVLFVLAMLTKVEGISLLGAVVLAEFFLAPTAQPRSLLARFRDRRMYARLSIFVVLGVVLVILWRAKTSLVNPTRGGVGVTPLDYFATQVRAWWYYVGKVVAPVRLIADYPNFPRSTWADTIAFREWISLVALASWIVIGVIAVWCARRAPAIAFLVLCFFAFLAPHSSFLPLFEPVNEHRPYLASIAVIMILCIAAGWVLARIRPAAVLALLLLAAMLIPLTRARNRVWHDPVSLWADTVAKVPSSDRAHTNYGVALSNANRLPEAEEQCRLALRISPDFLQAHITLGDVLLRRGDAQGALAAYDTAVRVLPNSDAPYSARGYFKAQLRDIPGAAEDMQRAVQLSGGPFTELAGAAECLIRLGRTDEAQPLIRRGQAIDARAFDAERRSFAALMGAPSPGEQVADGLAWLQKNRPFEAEWCFKEGMRLDPKDLGAKICLGILMDSQNRESDALSWFDQAAHDHPESPDPLYFRARARAARKQWEAALADLRSAQKLAPGSLREVAAIVECLIAAGRSADSDTVLAKVDPLLRADLDRERADFRDAIARR